MMDVALIADRNQSQLVLIDMQTKLTSVMPSEVSAVVKNIATLLQSVTLLEIPFLHTEQYPTVPELAQHLNGKKPVEKTAFSCCGEPTFSRQLSRDHSQVILAGMEAHICILQTAFDLQAQGKTVFVVEDAVISRNPENKLNALNRLRHAGVIITNTESLVFEWLAVAQGDAFKTISQLIR